MCGCGYSMDLTTNDAVITDAIKYVQGQMDHLNKTEKALLQDIKQKEGKEEEQNIEEQTTTNGVF
jgi:hemerythrin-like domain-containing protein